MTPSLSSRNGYMELEEKNYYHSPQCLFFRKAQIPWRERISFEYCFWNKECNPSGYVQKRNTKEGRLPRYQATSFSTYFCRHELQGALLKVSTSFECCGMKRKNSTFRAMFPRAFPHPCEPRLIRRHSEPNARGT